MVNTRTPRVLPVVSRAAVVTAVHETIVAAHSQAFVLCVHQVTSSIARRRLARSVMQVAFTIPRCVGAKAALWESFSRSQA